MQAIGRALALDPEDPGATTVLRELLMQRPEHRPPEVERALANAAAQQRAWAGRVASFAYMSFLLFVPLIWWAGVRSWASALPFFLASAIAALVAFVGTRKGVASRNSVMATMVISNIGIVGATTLFGPLVLLLGWMEPSYRFTAEGMVIVPHATELHEVSTITILLLAGLAAIVTGAVTMGRVREALVEAEERLYTYAWQIQQLLPDTARTDDRSVTQ